MHFCDFAGTGLPPRQLDDVTADVIKRKWLKEESALFDSKWFDYRTMHPFHATEYFAECYRSMYCHFAKERLDEEEGASKTGLKKGVLLDQAKTNITGLWRARQAADRIGCRYDFYVLTAMRWADRRSWRNIPRPTQLYSDDMIEYVSRRWALYSAQQLQIAEDESLINMDGALDPIQRSYLEYLKQQVAVRVHPALSVGSLISNYRVVSQSLARQEFGAIMVDRALRFCA